MVGLDLDTSESLQFAGVAVATYLLTWWVVRPLSFVYRLKDGCLTVRSFFLLPVATVSLSEISRVDVGKPPVGKRVRWLVSPYRRWTGQTLVAETDHAWFVLPDRLAARLAERSSPASLAAEACVQFRGDASYQRILVVLMVLNRTARRLASWCVPLAGAAAWCLIILPLWLTAVELTGSKLCAKEHHLPLSAVIDRSALPHFAASAFVITCGIAARGLLAFGKPLPWPLAGVTLFAAVSRLSLGFPGAHDILSHTLFDSCTGYDERHAIAGTTCLMAAIILALAAWNPDRGRTQLSEDAGLAATP